MGETSFLRKISISTFSEVLSSMFLTFILPNSLALTIESIRLDVVIPYGTPDIFNVLLSNMEISALTLILLPVFP